MELWDRIKHTAVLPFLAREESVTIKIHFLLSVRIKRKYHMLIVIPVRDSNYNPEYGN
jgi:hypothetical protein